MVFCSPGSHEAIRTVPTDHSYTPAYSCSPDTYSHYTGRVDPVHYVSVKRDMADIFEHSEVVSTARPHSAGSDSRSPGVRGVDADLAPSAPARGGERERESRPLGTGSTVSVHEADYDQVGEHS